MRCARTRREDQLGVRWCHRWDGATADARQVDVLRGVLDDEPLTLGVIQGSAEDGSHRRDGSWGAPALLEARWAVFKIRGQISVVSVRGTRPSRYWG